jgi:membrane-associated protease RseP (regulator of RpoE activity)
MPSSLEQDPRTPRSQFAPPVDPVQASEPPRSAARGRYRTHLVLFVLTVLSVFFAGSAQTGATTALDAVRGLLSGWVFAVPLMAILLAHEFGHYIAARIHGVPASLPYFIPMPISPLGTWGAVIAMRGRIGSRKALLDIGAAGPLAGMAVAFPVLVWGLLHSEVRPITGNGIQEGQCILYVILKRLTVGPIAAGQDVFLHPVAFAGWTGLFVTMLNLVPVGQLDGGHVSYALFGPAQNKIARAVHYFLPVLFLASFVSNLTSYGTLTEMVAHVWQALSNSMFWLVWFGLLFLLRWLGGRDHPPTEPGPLGPVRSIVAAVTMLLFVSLFMLTPMAQY